MEVLKNSAEITTLIFNSFYVNIFVITLSFVLGFVLCSAFGINVCSNGLVFGFNLISDSFVLESSFQHYSICKIRSAAAENANSK